MTDDASKTHAILLRVGRSDVSAHYFPEAAASQARDGAVLFFPKV